MDGGSYTPMGYFQSGGIPNYNNNSHGPPGPPGNRRPSGENSIWVGDLDAYMDENFLRSVVNACGWGADITRIKVVRDRYSGSHSGYGFFDAVSPEAAARVLNSGSGMPIPGTNRCWRLNMGRSANGGVVQAETNVYVGDLEPSTTDFELMSAFRPRYSSVRHAKIVCNEFGQSKGYGFVRFASAQEAERAVVEMNGFEFHSKPIRLSMATGRANRRYDGPGHGGHGHHGHYGGGGPRRRATVEPDDPNNTTLFIGGTGPHVTEDILWREFGIFGEIDAVRVPVNKTGFAFVRFKTRADAERAKEELSGTHFISLNAHKPVRLEWAAEQLSVPRNDSQMQDNRNVQSSGPPPSNAAGPSGDNPPTDSNPSWNNSSQNEAGGQVAAAQSQQ
eukprot:Plantae.Rhodophyta-Hildenbrandia_rubra.ctg5964.p1 GENE.Plantae.Rhodophyta-Hildenbrandia_rubra.ctg5964~~Plantae.Rhodophyta-Hildenbrandia_rubra.ctg5964.p1  ORF type:complete len:390 (+),score=67.56 Plantae.Rhodophyta-Hildenbrandia_rubra.ctg5964:293-1462(+)